MNSVSKFRELIKPGEGVIFCYRMSSSPYLVIQVFLKSSQYWSSWRGWVPPTQRTPQNVVLIVLICLSSHLDQTRQTFSHYKFMHQILVILAGNRERKKRERERETSNTVPVHRPSRLYSENYVQASDSRLTSEDCSALFKWSILTVARGILQPVFTSLFAKDQLLPSGQSNKDKANESPDCQEYL